MTKKKPAKKPVKKSGPKSGNAKGTVTLAPQPHGGAIRVGSLPGNTPGTGRPPDEIRARLRELGAKKSVPFLESLLDGEIPVKLLGKCAECGHDQPITTEWVEVLLDQFKASVDQRLKASEQTMKYGLATKELVIASTEAAAFFDCVYAAMVEQHGQQAAEVVKARAVAMMDAKA